MKYSATMWPWFSTFLLKPFVNRVNRLIPILIERLLRSTNDVEMWSGSGLNVGLIVSFVPYSEIIDFVQGFSRRRLEIPSFADEYLALERRYGKSTNRFADDSSQENFEFPAEGSETVNSSTEGLDATSFASHDEDYGSNAPLAAGQAAGF